MLKLISVDQALFQDEPVIRLLDDFKMPGLIKQAETDDRIAAYAKNIQPHPNRIYVHFVAMGAMEYWGFNRNADAFPEANLIASHKTFETNPAHVFRHHLNKQKEIAMGEVVLSIYNERMRRVELVAWIDKERGKDIVARIERGDFPASSMACRTPYDQCSICGHQAHSRAEYCKHLAMDLGKILPDGRKVGALNVAPLSFFDISIVVRPADVTSSVLQKLAFDQGSPVVGSAEEAEIEELQEKSSSIKKLSELIKEVEGEITGSADSLNALLDKIKDPDDEVLDFLVHYDLHHVIHALAELGISPSVSFFAKLISQKMAGEHTPGIEHLVKGLMKAEPESVEVNTDVSEMSKSASVHPRVQITSALSKFTKQASLYPGMALERAFDLSAYEPQAPMGLVGYAGQGPNVSVDPADTYRKLKASMSQESHGLLKTLFTVAGLAIAAKFLLSKMIEAKMQEVLSQQANAQSGAKINLVKSATEAITTQKLVKADLLRNLKF
jgi:hypothetical protein